MQTFLDAAGWLSQNVRHWDSISERWRALPAPDPAAVRLLLDHLALRPGDLLLDAGCGSGRWGVPLAEAGYRVRGVDFSPRMVAAAEETAGQRGLAGDRLHVQVGEAAHLPFADACFDGVLCMAVLDFVPSPGAALLEFRRVLKPGRRLLLQVLGAYSPVKRQAWRRFLPDGAASNAFNHILPWEAEALLGELGWQVLAQRGFFEPAASGTPNPYSEVMSDRLPNRVLQQTIATSWRFVALKPESLLTPAG